jgi:hypothetical protein
MTLLIWLEAGKPEIRKATDVFASRLPGFQACELLVIYI